MFISYLARTQLKGMVSELEDKKQQEYEEKKQRAYINRRAIMDFGMGIIYAGVGGFFMLSDVIMGAELAFPPKPFSYIFGALCLLYGGFRIYRGIKRDYYK
jgi:hypothetical protein